MKRICTVIALLALAGTSSAQRAYVGATYGMTSLKISCAGTSDCDVHDSGPKAYAGLNLTPMVAIEVAYIDFGSASYTVGGTARASGDAQAFAGSIALRHAFIPEFSGVLRLGFASVKASGAIATAGGSAESSTSRIRPYYGLGLEYRFDKIWSAVGSADFTRGEVGGVNARLEMYSIGAQASF